MKIKNEIMKKAAALFLGLVLSLGLAQAQEGEPPVGKGFPNPEILTEDQLAQLEANKAAREAGREAFRSTLSEEQLAILENEELDRRERKEALHATLTEDQQAILDANREASRAAREEFRSTLTDEQRAQLRESGVRERRQGARRQARIRRGDVGE